MNADELEPLASFALLGPGYTGRPGFLLLDGLRPAAPGDRPPRLVYVPFESAPEDARVLTAERTRRCGPPSPPRVRPEVSFRPRAYASNVARIRESIAAGDVYQVCYTVRAELRGVGGADLLALMCRRGVPRFAAWVRLPWGEEFVSASPELFFETDRTRAHAEPMKGTARRGAGGALAASEKDRAELAMITDLVRNDLTPVCRPRTVAVACERRRVDLPYAVQTVSDVVGRLRRGTTPLDVLAALHPGGSVTGAPKSAALAMIGTLEEGPRGAYCGSLGLLTRSRSRFALLIRTARRAGDRWVYGVGGGIVHDSDAAAEREELRVKMGAFA